MTDLPVDIYFGFIILGGAAISVLSIVFLRLTLTHRLKAKLMETDDYWDPLGTINFDFFNTAVFAWACIAPWYSKLEGFQRWFPNLDVRSFARWYERIAAYGTIGGLALMFLGAPFFYLFTP